MGRLSSKAGAAAVAALKILHAAETERVDYRRRYSG
jgi:hypothetical protein